MDDDGKISQVGVASFVSGQGCHVVIPAGKTPLKYYGLLVVVLFIFLFSKGITNEPGIQVLTV